VTVVTPGRPTQSRSENASIKVKHGASQDAGEVRSRRGGSGKAKVVGSSGGGIQQGKEGHGGWRSDIGKKIRACVKNVPST